MLGLTRLGDDTPARDRDDPLSIFALGYDVSVQTLDSLDKAYAKGWYCLAEISAFETNKAKGFNIFGRYIVISCDHDAMFYALDGYCPHMGADLALGDVTDEGLVCRFHAWRWGADGRCNHIPYAKRIPPKALIKTYPVKAINGFVFIWFGSAEPEYDIPALPMDGEPGWSDWITQEWTIPHAPMDIVDNLADVAHFGPVHYATGTLFYANRFEGHRATQVMVGDYEGFGQTARFANTATYYGPAYQVTHLTGSISGMPIEMVLLNTHVPVADRKTKLLFAVLVKLPPALPEAQGRAVAENFARLQVQSLQSDVDIWTNKVHVETPMLCDGDGPIVLCRQWYAQFFESAKAQMPTQDVISIHDMAPEETPVIAHVFESVR